MVCFLITCWGREETGSIHVWLRRRIRDSEGLVLFERHGKRIELCFVIQGCFQEQESLEEQDVVGCALDIRCLALGIHERTAIVEV